MYIVSHTLGDGWSELLLRLTSEGARVSPRGVPCRELMGVTFKIEDARWNLFVSEARKISYRFAIAEWLWIWYGHNDVRTIAQYNKNIAQFSDNGVTFFGGYGVPIQLQWDHVIERLKKDASSRQAVIVIYKQPYYETKDVPCTIALQFLIRDDKLHTLAMMRSSDVWLGIPYDAFNFSMLGNILAAQLGVEQGSLTFFLGSSHLYETNLVDASTVLARDDYASLRSPQLVEAPVPDLEDVLVDRKIGGWTFNSPWSHYARVLTGQTNREALDVLTELMETEK